MNPFANLFSDSKTFFRIRNCVLIGPSGNGTAISHQLARLPLILRILDDARGPPSPFAGTPTRRKTGAAGAIRTGPTRVLARPRRRALPGEASDVSRSRAAALRGLLVRSVRPRSACSDLLRVPLCLALRPRLAGVGVVTARCDRVPRAGDFVFGPPSAGCAAGERGTAPRRGRAPALARDPPARPGRPSRGGARRCPPPGRPAGTATCRASPRHRLGTQRQGADLAPLDQERARAEVVERVHPDATSRRDSAPDFAGTRQRTDAVVAVRRRRDPARELRARPLRAASGRARARCARGPAATAAAPRRVPDVAGSLCSDDRRDPGRRRSSPRPAATSGCARSGKRQATPAAREVRRRSWTTQETLHRGQAASPRGTASPRGRSGGHRQTSAGACDPTRGWGGGGHAAATPQGGPGAGRGDEEAAPASEAAWRRRPCPPAWRRPPGAATATPGPRRREAAPPALRSETTTTTSGAAVVAPSGPATRATSPSAPAGACRSLRAPSLPTRSDDTDGGEEGAPPVRGGAAAGGRASAATRWTTAVGGVGGVSGS